MNKAWLGLAIAGGVICLSSIIVPTILSTTILNNNHDYNRGVNLLNIREGDDLSNKVLHFDKNYTLPYIANVNKNVWVRCVIYFYERPSLQFYAGTTNNKGVFGQEDVWDKVLDDVGIKDDFNTYQFAAFVAVMDNQVDPNKCWCFYKKDENNPNADPKWLPNNNERTDTFTFPPNSKVGQLKVAIDDFSGAGNKFYKFLEHQIVKNH